MKILEHSEKNIICELSPVEILMISALIRECYFGTKIHAIDLRLGFKENEVERLSSDIRAIKTQLNLEE